MSKNFKFIINIQDVCDSSFGSTERCFLFRLWFVIFFFSYVCSDLVEYFSIGWDGTGTPNQTSIFLFSFNSTFKTRCISFAERFRAMIRFSVHHYFAKHSVAEQAILNFLFIQIPFCFDEIKSTWLASDTMCNALKVIIVAGGGFNLLMCRRLIRERSADCKKGCFFLLLLNDYSPSN